MDKQAIKLTFQELKKLVDSQGYFTDFDCLRIYVGCLMFIYSDTHGLSMDVIKEKVEEVFKDFVFPSTQNKYVCRNLPV